MRANVAPIQRRRSPSRSGLTARAHETKRATLFLGLSRRMSHLEHVRGFERGHTMRAAVEPSAEDHDLPTACIERKGELRIDRERTANEEIDMRDDPLACEERKHRNPRSESRERDRPRRGKQRASRLVVKAKRRRHAASAERAEKRDVGRRPARPSFLHGQFNERMRTAHSTQTRERKCRTRASRRRGRRILRRQRRRQMDQRRTTVRPSWSIARDEGFETWAVRMPW